MYLVRACLFCAVCRLPLLPLLPRLRAVFCSVCSVCSVCSACCAVPAVQYLALLPPALLPLLYRDPESPGTAPTLATCRADALHAALLYASVTIISYA